LKCHKKIPCVAILNKKNSFFSSTKSENMRAVEVLPGRGGLVPEGRRRRWGKGI
jgi:hypothetical protein